MTMFTIDYLSRKIRSKNLDFETKVISDQRIKQLYFTLIKKLDLLQAIYNAQFTKKLSQKKIVKDALRPCFYGEWMPLNNKHRPSRYME